MLLDIGLPGMDGYEVARRLRHSPEFEGPLVALTGWGQEDDRRRSREAGFDAHLVKPVDVRRPEDPCWLIASRPQPRDQTAPLVRLIFVMIQGRNCMLS